MRVFFSVGEPSGDLHAAKLITNLQSRGVQCVGYGGPKMREAGCQVHFQLTDMAVMGIAAILPLLGKFIQLAKRAGQLFDADRPDAVVLVDFPGFNWWVARAARKRGIPVYYYLPPQLWAWAPWRIHKMRRLIDKVLCCLPFEFDWYRERNMPAEFVGHPFFDEVASHPLDPAFLKQQAERKAAGNRVIGVLPGSRNLEVAMNFPVQCMLMEKLRERFPTSRFLVASYRESQRTYCAEHLKKHHPDLPVDLHVGKTSEIIEAAETCVLVSGSVSLEVLARTTPSVVVYCVSTFSVIFLKPLIRCKYFCLANLIADWMIMPEFAPCRTPEVEVAQMADQLGTWLASPVEMAKRKAEMRLLRDRVASPGATRNAADAIMRELDRLPLSRAA